MTNKLSADYGREISSLRIHPDDMAELAVSEGQPVRLVSPYGEATVTCQSADVPRRTFFLPLGPIANQLFSGAHTDGTGVPDWKRQPVTVQACEQPWDNQTTHASCRQDASGRIHEPAVVGQQSTVVHDHVVCTFCGCLCDDIEVEVRDNQISKVKKACLIGRNKILHAQSNAPAPSIAGRAVSIAETVDEAARILRNARFPLVYGLSSATTEAQRVLVEITESWRHARQSILVLPRTRRDGPPAGRAGYLYAGRSEEPRGPGDFLGLQPAGISHAPSEPVFEPAQRAVHSAGRKGRGSWPSTSDTPHHQGR